MKSLLLQSYPPSTSCYLDGRYFNMVLKDYPGLIENPLYINMVDESHIQMAASLVLTEHVGLLRVIVTASAKGGSMIPDIRHCMLVLLDHPNKKASIYDPDIHNPELHVVVVKNIIEYLQQFLDYEYIEIETTNPPKEQLPHCDKSGVCNALVLLYAYKFINGKTFTAQDVLNVRKFMTAVEKNYTLPTGVPDVEYDSRTQKQVLGTVGGAALGVGIGAATGGLGGALILGGVGGLGGYALGSVV